MAGTLSLNRAVRTCPLALSCIAYDSVRIRIKRTAAHQGAECRGKAREMTVEERRLWGALCTQTGECIIEITRKTGGACDLHDCAGHVFKTVPRR